jgi:hypothetical protein
MDDVCVLGYPTIYAFTKNAGEKEKATLFEGTPNSTTLIDFGNKVLGQPCEMLRTKDSAQQWLDKPGHSALVIVGLVTDGKSQPAMTVQAAARDLLLESCVVTDSKLVYAFVLAEASSKGHPTDNDATTAVALTDFTYKEVLGELKGDAIPPSSNALGRWVKGRRMPLTITFRESDDQGKKMMERAKSHSLMLLDLPVSKDEYTDETKASLKAFEAVAAEYRGLGSHVLVPGEEEAMCDYLGVNTSTGSTAYPAQVFLNISTNGDHAKVMGATAPQLRKAIAAEANDPGAVQRLLAAHEARFFYGATLDESMTNVGSESVGVGGQDATDEQPVEAAAGGEGEGRVVVVRSADTPSKQALVQKIVGTTFEAEVLRDHAHDVLIKFATNECGALCRQAAKEFTKLAKMLKRQKVGTMHHTSHCTKHSTLPAFESQNGILDAQHSLSQHQPIRSTSPFGRIPSFNCYHASFAHPPPPPLPQ